MAGSSQNKRRGSGGAKRPRSGWQKFMADNREEVKRQNPNIRHQEIFKKLGEMWRQTDDETKRRYQKQYQAGQAEYDEKSSGSKDGQKNKKQQSSNSKQNNGQGKKGNNNNNNNNESNEYDEESSGSKDEQKNKKKTTVIQFQTKYWTRQKRK